MEVKCQFVEMSENKIRILEATLQTVSRYGVRKTSVSDIARASGLSRQTIYNMFETRDDIFRAAIAYAGELSRSRLREQLSNLDDLPQKLDAMFDAFVVAGFEFSRRSPDAHDIVEGSHEVGHDELVASFSANADLIADILAPDDAVLAGKGIDRHQLATAIEIAGRGFKRDAASLSQLRHLISAQRMLVEIAVS